MDRNMTLTADQGMRILMKNEVTTAAPYFLASNDALWEAWCKIQARGSGEENAFWITKGWRISSRHLPNGGSIMRLEIRFDPCEERN